MGLFSLRQAWQYSFVIALVAGALLTSSCSKTQHEQATVVSDDAPVYSQGSATDAAKAILQKGDLVTLQPSASSGPECWLNVGWASKPPRAGFIRCADVHRSTPAASPVPSMTAGRQPDHIDQLLTLAGIDRHVQRITDASNLRFLFNTQRLDENDARVRQVYERALRPALFYDPIHASIERNASEQRIQWLTEQFSRPLVRKVVESRAQGNSLESKRDLVPYLTGVLPTSALASRVRLVERIEKALNEPEAVAEVWVALTRGAAKAQVARLPQFRQVDPGQLDLALDNLRSRAIKESAHAVRISNLYFYAPLSEEELQQYTLFVESADVKWMYGVMHEGIAKGTETLAREIVTGLASLTKAGRLLRDPAEGRDPQELYEQGVRLIDNGKELEAIRFLDAAIQLKPDYAIAFYKRGNAYRERERASEAVSDYTQAIHFDPSMTLAHVNRGVIYRFLGQPQRALEDLTEGIQANPHVSGAWIERALTYETLEKHMEAVADYSQAIRITPTDGEAWAWRGMAHGQLGEWQRSWQDCEIGIRLGTRPSELAPVYHCTGRALGNMKEFTRAMAELDRSIELDPRKAAVTYGNRGWLWEEMGKVEAALRDYDKSIELDPSEAWTHCQRAKALDKLGRSADAAADRAYCSADQK